MKIASQGNQLTKISSDLLVIGVFIDEKPSEVLKQLDPEFPVDFLESIDQICEQEGFTAKSGQSVPLPTYGKLQCSKLIIRGLGKKEEYTGNNVRKAMANIARRTAAHGNFRTASFQLRFDESAVLQAAVEGWFLGSYAFKKYKNQNDEEKKGTLPEDIFFNVDMETNEFDLAVKRGTAIAEATNFARDLIAEPAGYMTPTRLAEAAKSIEGLQCQVLDAEQVRELGMGAFLGVAKGAKEPAQFVVLTYNGTGASPEGKKYAFVGKGITFDSGGLSLKTAQGMENMKYDMSGAAVVIATMRALASLKPKVTAIGVIAATENMPGGSATHPGDVLVAMNGKTIEVNNTDAEGRLVLADALSYVAKEKPDEIIDVATLTGAVVTALGRAAAGIMGNNDELVARLIKSGESAGEKLWQLPLFDEYKDSLKSDIADLKNAGSKGEAASCCAGMFLKEFVNGSAWAHMDIAGPAWMDKEKDELNKGGTAFGARTLIYYILSQAE